MNKEDIDKFIAAVQEFARPENQVQRLKDKWSKAAEICAVHIDMTHDPAPDGTFEILFLTPKEAQSWVDRDPIYNTKISFISGVTLARHPDCSGGSFMLNEAKVIVAVNDDARAQNEKYDLRL